MREISLERGRKDRKKAIELALSFSWHSRQQERRWSSLERERARDSERARVHLRGVVKATRKGDKGEDGGPWPLGT